MDLSNFKVGNKVKMRVPKSSITEPLMCHIEAIIKNPTSDIEDDTVIVFRYWSKYKQCWYWKAQEFWLIEIYNKDTNSDN